MAQTATTKSPAPATDYLGTLRKSGLVDARRLSEFVTKLSTQSPEWSRRPNLLAERLLHEGLITDWQNRHLMAGRSKGYFVGSYKLLRQIGSGGMSTVYLAEHTLLQRSVALKVVNPAAAPGDPHFLERFFLEVRAHATLDHPNIVRVYDGGMHGQLYFLVLEYVEGSDLQKHVHNVGPLPPLQAAVYIRQTAQALARAHAAGLIHRDIKPANLLLSNNDCIKLLDLGLVRNQNQDGESLTLAGNVSMLGTADYIAPEQAVDSHHVDGRADIYALGCTLYYLLTGSRPFRGQTLAQVLMKHQTEPAPSPRDVRPEVPEELAAICLKMMAKRPDERFQTCEELDQALALITNPPAIREVPLVIAPPVLGIDATINDEIEDTVDLDNRHMNEVAQAMLASSRQGGRRISFTGVSRNLYAVVDVVRWLARGSSARKSPGGRGNPTPREVAEKQ